MNHVRCLPIVAAAGPNRAGRTLGIIPRSPAVDEADGNAAPLHLGRDLRPRAVDDDDLVAGSCERDDLLRGSRRDGAAHLHDHPAHER